MRDAQAFNILLAISSESDYYFGFRKELTLYLIFSDLHYFYAGEVSRNESFRIQTVSLFISVHHIFQ